MRRYAFLLLLAGSIILSLGASCPQPAPGATLTTTTDRSQIDVTLRIKGHGYTPGQPVTITIQDVPVKSGNDVVRTPIPDAAGNFEIFESFGLKHVPFGTKLADVVVIGRDSSGWSLVSTKSAGPFVIFV